MTKTLERFLLEGYQLMHPDVYKKEPWVFPILSASVVALHAGLWYFKPPRFVHPASFYIATIGQPNTAKSTILKTTERFLKVGEVTKLEESTPEKLRDNLSDLVSNKGFAPTYITWDEAGELIKKLNSYMDALPYILNRAYYSGDISFGTATKGSKRVPEGSYILNMYFGSLPEQWAEIEELSAGGFSRRVLPIQMTSKLPYVPGTPEEEEFNIELITKWDELKREVIPILKYLQSRRWFIGMIRGLYHIAEKVETDNELMDEKKRMIVEYLYKVITARTLANIIPFKKDLRREEYEWMDEEVQETAEKLGATIRINEEELKKFSNKETIYIYIGDYGHPPFIRTLEVRTAEEFFKSIPKQDSSVSTCHQPPTPQRLPVCEYNNTHTHTHTHYIDTCKTLDTQEAGEASVGDASNTDFKTRNRHETRQHELLESIEKLANDITNLPITSGMILRLEKQLSIAMYALPTSAMMNFLMLRRSTLQPSLRTAPDVEKNVSKIENFLKSHPDKKVLKLRDFVKVLSLGKAQDYNPVMEVLEAGEFIRKLPRSPDPISGRQRFWIVIDTEARICGNCLYYGTGKCPRVSNIQNYTSRLSEVDPSDKACDKFRHFGEVVSE